MNKGIKLQEKKAMNSGSRFKFFSAKDMKEIDDTEHIIEIKFASYGNIDSDRDLLVRGCFAKSISDRGPDSSTNRKIAFLWQHNMQDPIGKILKIEEREDGAYATVKLSNFDAVPNAKRAYIQLHDGDINQFSFGFSYVWDKLEYDEELDAFIVKEVKLYEISVVTFGSNEQTRYIGDVKGEDVNIYIKELLAKDKDKFNQIKQAILDAEAEPGLQPLTLESNMFDKIAENLK